MNESLLAYNKQFIAVIGSNCRHINRYEIFRKCCWI